MTFEKKLNWGDVVLAALFEASTHDGPVDIQVPNKQTAKIVYKALAALQEAGDVDVWRINVEITEQH
tara:strand:+ start:7090 stop:7290 length:201 start_codon:yes stop_codon:yes gene_type:complete